MSRFCKLQQNKISGIHGIQAMTQISNTKNSWQKPPPNEHDNGAFVQRKDPMLCGFSFIQ